MAKKKYNLSFSEFNLFKQCPLKWYYNNVLYLPGDVSEETLFGGALHNSIEDLLTKPTYKKQAFWEFSLKANLKKKLEEVKDEVFLTKFTNTGLSYFFVKQGYELLTHLNFFTRFKDYDILEVEFKLDGMSIIEFDDIEFCFKGYIDLVLKHKITGRILLIDWKTSKKMWDIKKKMKENDDFFAQLALYKNYYSIKTGTPLNQIDCWFFNLPREEAKEMNNYVGTINETYLEFLIDDLKETCTKIYHQNFSELSKAKFIHKKNYCNRCQFNNEENCNDYEEFQKLII